jgi:hypothetical protein
MEGSPGPQLAVDKRDVWRSDWSSLCDGHDGSDEDLLFSQVLVDQLDSDGALAYRGGDAFR